MLDFLFANFIRLDKYFDLNKIFIRNTIKEIIAQKLITENFLSNKTLALRVSNSWIEAPNF